MGVNNTAKNPIFTIVINNAQTSLNYKKLTLIRISYFIFLIWFIQQVIFAGYLFLYNNNNFVI